MISHANAVLLAILSFASGVMAGMAIILTRLMLRR